MTVARRAHAEHLPIQGRSEPRSRRRRGRHEPASSSGAASPRPRTPTCWLLRLAPCRAASRPLARRARAPRRGGARVAGPRRGPARRLVLQPWSHGREPRHEPARGRRRVAAAARLLDADIVTMRRRQRFQTKPQRWPLSGTRWFVATWAFLCGRRLASKGGVVRAAC